MAYDTQIIYSSTDNSKNFSLNGFNFYITPASKPKKMDSNHKRYSITEQEFQENQKQYNFIFDKNVSL